jgi:hypothetical protein
MSGDDKLTPCLIEIKCLDNDHGYVPLVINTSRSKEEKKYSIPGDDGILVKILTNYFYLNL